MSKTDRVTVSTLDRQITILQGLVEYLEPLTIYLRASPTTLIWEVRRTPNRTWTISAGSARLDPAGGSTTVSPTDTRHSYTLTASNPKRYCSTQTVTVKA